MSKHRDRHGRGLRGPLVRSLPGGFSIDRRFRLSRGDRFAAAVDAGVEKISGRDPRLFHGIAVGIEDVPPVTAATTHVPLAIATEPTPEWPARIVLYRRPLEHRCDSQRSLERLVYRTLAEQLAALMGVSVWVVAPDLEDEN